MKIDSKWYTIFNLRRKQRKRKLITNVVNGTIWMNDILKTDEALNLSLINRRMYIEIYSCPMCAQWRQLSRLYLNSHTSSQWTTWHAIYWRIFTFECGCTRWLSRSYCIQGNRDFSTSSLRYMNKKHKLKYSQSPQSTFKKSCKTHLTGVTDPLAPPFPVFKCLGFCCWFQK